MKRIATVTAGLIVSALLLPQSSFAADKRGDQRAETPAVREHPGGLIQSQWLQRRAIKDDAGNELGKIEEVWLDPKDGRVKGVVVSVGGFLGIGERHRILPWQDVHVTWEKQDLVVRVSESALRRARVYEDPGDRGRQPAASPDTERKR
jgi:sporulation protein YlmC with PRC-barrel domain